MSWGFLMRFEWVKKLSEGEFRRLTGIKRATFGAMLSVLREAEYAKERKGGKKPKLALEDRILLTLEYWREYRTQFHIASSYGVSESSVCRTIRWIEDVLIGSGAFSLPGKQALRTEEISYNVLVLDATETPIERPKKRVKPSAATLEKRKSIR
jgi:hypothetical protein